MEQSNQVINQQTVQNATPVVSSEKKKSYKWIWFFLIGVILIIGFIFLYFYFSTGSFNIKSTTTEKQITVTPTVQQAEEENLQSEVEALDLGDLDKDLKDIETDITSLQ